MSVSLEDFERRSSKQEAAQFAGLEYDDHGGGREGCYITLFVTEGTPSEQVERAKREAQNNRDVLGFHVEKIPEEWLEPLTPGGENMGWIEAARYITKHGYRRIDMDSGKLVDPHHRGGAAVDTFSASALVQVYDALSPENQRKFNLTRVDKAVQIAFTVLNKSAGIS